MDNRSVVSFDDEPLILVDTSNRITGHLNKRDCHTGDGVLHRALSVFLFDKTNQLLLQQRSSEKMLWPLIWSNSCCSHPRRGESVMDAATRRTVEELGVQVQLTELFSFIYHASFGDLGSEHEYCTVFAGRYELAAQSELSPNPREIESHKWVAPPTLDAAIGAKADCHADDFLGGAQLSPWFKLEWPRLRREHWNTVKSL